MSPVTDWRTETGSAMSEAQAAALRAAAAEQEASRSGIAWTADVVITYNGLIALSLAPRTAVFNVPLAKLMDRVYVHRSAAPSAGGVTIGGIILEGTGFVPEAGKVEVYHVIPALGIGQTMLIPLKLVGLRAAT